MKKIIFTLVLGMIASLSFPQTYHKLIRTNTFWDNYYVVLPEFCYTGANRIFFTDQDTVISGLTYKISKSQPYIPLGPGPFCPPFVIDTSSYDTYQFLREDTLAKKVYIYTPDYYGGTDQLFYDFSLLAGDTLKSSFYLAIGDTLVVDSVGNFLLNNGEVRKVFWFKSNLEAYYIEGIGASQGLFYPLQIGFTESYGGYFCIKENSVNLWGDKCDYGYVGQNEMKVEPVSVFPNPANSFINIVVPRNYEGSDLILINLQGQQVFIHSLNRGSNTFSISDIIPGVYFYQIKSNQLIHNGKLTIY